MNQIAIGDASGGWLVLQGEGVAAPFKRAAYEMAASLETKVEENLFLSLEGSPGDLAAGLAGLEGMVLHCEQYQQAYYPAPVCLRFQPMAGGEYAYASIWDLTAIPNPNASETRLTGSLMVRLQFTRANHYDSDWEELPLSGKGGTNVLGGYDLFNHTDVHAGHGNTALIKSTDIDTVLPAPLRFELKNTTATGALRDVLVGIYHSPDVDAETALFCYSAEFDGGSLFSNTNAINGYYVRVSWAASDWTALGSWLLENETVQALAGASYRPALRFYNAHAYADLHLKLKLQAGTNILWEGASAYVDAAYGYVLFPPIAIPPNRLLHETFPHHIDLCLYGQHDSAGAETLDFDCLLLLPLSPGANFIAFYDLLPNATLIDDNFLGHQLSQFTPGGSETVAHLRQGAPLTVSPGQHHRLVFLLTDQADRMDIFRTAQVRVFYRKRRRVL